jgi:hypothetical protein
MRKRSLIQQALDCPVGECPAKVPLQPRRTGLYLGLSNRSRFKPAAVIVRGWACGLSAGGQEHRCLNEVAPGRPVRRLFDGPLALARCFDAAHAKLARWDVRWWRSRGKVPTARWQSRPGCASSPGRPTTASSVGAAGRQPDRRWLWCRARARVVDDAGSADDADDAAAFPQVTQEPGFSGSGSAGARHRCRFSRCGRPGAPITQRG